MKPYIFLFLIIASSIICFAGCEKYNYSQVFGIDKTILANGENIDGGEGKIIKLNIADFEKLKPDMARNGFINWVPVDIYYGIKSKKFQLKGKENDKIMFSAKKEALDGVSPVISYDSEANLLYLIFSDGIGG
jgi:hypothetical protein